MSWYRTGTVTVANGSPTVTGAGTDFVANAQIGHAFLGPDGRTYEVAQVVSATALTLVSVYLGGSGGGQGYAIMPTQSYMRDLALGAAELLNSFATVRDGIGQGFVGDGTTAAPGLRFAADADTGLRRVNNNALSLVTGGSDRLVVDSIGRVGMGGFPTYAIDVFSAGGPYVGRLTNTAAGSDEYAVLLIGQREAGSPIGYIGTGGSAVANLAFRNAFVVGTSSAHHLVLSTADIERARIDVSGNLLVGVSSGTSNRFAKPDAGGESQKILGLGVTSGDGHHFHTTAGIAGSASATAYRVHSNSTTGRSINAGGTINASGADYAEYMTKADGCGTIAPGDVCGIDIDGKLTRTWADAVSFVVKSTDPAYVGGDVWGQSVGERPEGPGIEPTAPIAPPAEPASDSDDDLSAWRDAIAAYPALVSAHQTAHSAWEAARTAHATALATWDAALEAERQKVDRIAFCGQVPVNVTGGFAVGDYLIAAAAGAGIKATAVPAADITFDQYRRRVGKVWAVRDGRAWVDVQHG